MAEEAADTKRAVHQKGGGTAAAARAHTWPRRGPGISGALRGAQASSENDEMEDVELKEDHVETDGDGAQADRAGADTTSDAWSDAGDSQADSQALHIQGSGSPVEVAVEPPVVYHMSWEAWQSYLKSYCATTKQVLVVQETFSRAEQNKRLSKTKRGGDASQLVPEDLDPYSRVYICTHGWKKRKSRGTGSRPRQHIRLTNCPFRFRVQWNLERMEFK
ncbi:hypothetical protein PF002_g32192 [Phytophthora fragariae]|uniref:FAR1 domain-containing protein n=1 Tax=Phytophthora fragariae TaxID=53985 RepID=A0A6A3V8Y9_9STRA|nr:hypothetical protein PF002_g32192 [Phytophthora fragariae]